MDDTIFGCLCDFFDTLFDLIWDLIADLLGIAAEPA